MRAGLLLAVVGVLAAGAASAQDLDRAAHTDNGPPLMQAAGSDERDMRSLRGEHDVPQIMRDLVASREPSREIE